MNLTSHVIVLFADLLASLIRTSNSLTVFSLFIVVLQCLWHESTPSNELNVTRDCAICRLVGFADQNLKLFWQFFSSFIIVLQCLRHESTRQREPESSLPLDRIKKKTIRVVVFHFALLLLPILHLLCKLGSISFLFILVLRECKNLTNLTPSHPTNLTNLTLSRPRASLRSCACLILFC